MKLKIILLVSLTFLLVACPTKDEDIYIDLKSLSVQASCYNSASELKDTITCKDEFRIYLDFKSSQIAQNTSFSSSVGVVYASYEPIIYFQNKVAKCNILSTEEFNNHSVNTEINNYFELCIDNSNWINDLSMIEGINESIKLQYKRDVKAYLKLNTNSNLNYTGKFIVKMELLDGMVLADTTKNVLIKITK